MKIIRTWVTERVREASWPRGQKSQMPPAQTPLSPVVAAVGFPGKTTASNWITADW